MTSHERVLRALEFRNPDRVPFLSPFPLLSDFFYMTFYPASDWQPAPGHAPHLNPALLLLGNWRWKHWRPEAFLSSRLPREDEFGCVWESPRADNVGEVKDHPLKSLDAVDAIHIPNPRRPERFETFERLAQWFGRDKFLLGDIGNGIWERAHFLRGFALLMEDLALNPEAVERLLDRLVSEWHLGMIDSMADRGCHGVIMPDDWGMQDRLMISPAMWRRIFKPRYARLIDAAHARGMKFFLHSCGNIRAILPDLIEIGLDALQKEDIENIGSQYVADNFPGKISFLSPVDVQNVLPAASDRDIAREVRKMIRLLGARGGGLMGMTTMSPEAVGIPWRKNFVVHYYFDRYGKYA